MNTPGEQLVRIGIIKSLIKQAEELAKKLDDNNGKESRFTRIQREYCEELELIQNDLACREKAIKNGCSNSYAAKNRKIVSCEISLLDAVI